MTLTDKEIKEALRLLDEMLEGNEREKQKGSAHAFENFLMAWVMNNTIY